ncbi:MAG: MerR family transcriptional regulator [Phycisphaerae bacterium]|nr:MerR family transcriptional regulator [Phycisphaerae bacterium]
MKPEVRRLRTSNLKLSTYTIGVCVSNEEPKLVPIGLAAEKAGVSRQSLQYYLMVGLLEPTTVTPAGRRLFDRKAIERVRLIRRLNDGGYPLRAIRELFMEGH